MYAKEFKILSRLYRDLPLFLSVKMCNEVISSFSVEFYVLSIRPFKGSNEMRAVF